MPRRVKTEITSSAALLLGRLLICTARGPWQIMWNTILNHSTPIEMCLIFRKSPFSQPFYTPHQLNSWLENSREKKQRGRKGSENVLIKIFFPIFYTHWRKIKEEFPSQFISSPEIKHVFANHSSLYKREALCVCQSGSAAQWLNWQIILTQSCSRALPLRFPSHLSPWQLASYLG